MTRRRLIGSPEKRTRQIARRESRSDSTLLFHGEIHSPILKLQRTLGNQRVVQMIQAKRLTPQGKIIGLQPKLTVGAAADQFEQEADRVASQVLSMSDSVAANSMQPSISPEEEKDQKPQTKPLFDLITPIAQRNISKGDAEDKSNPAKFIGSLTDCCKTGTNINSQVKQRTCATRSMRLRGKRRMTDPNFSPPSIQRRIGDGHDLRSPRFSGDFVLEACFDNERLLTVGARGDAVRKLQQALIDAGFPLPKFGVDGIFGNETRAAVRNFQQATGISVDGLVGPQTMEALDVRFSGPTPPGPTPPGPTPPGPTPPGPTPPGPTPPGPTPATITSRTVATSPGARTRTTIGVGEEIDLTHSAGSVTWSTTAGTLSATTGATVRLSAPDTGQVVTVTAGTASIRFTVIAPSGVHMDRFPGTGIRHTQDFPDSGIQTRPFLLPDTVNFNNVQYHEVDIGAVANGTYSCHSGVGHDASPATLTLSNTVVAGKGTRANARDTVYSGHCGGAAPFTPGSISFAIPYEYRVGAGTFHPFATVDQVHTLAADASTLTTDKAGANGGTTVTAVTSTF